MANDLFDKTVKPELTQMDKIAKIIDSRIEIKTIFDKFPPKPIEVERTDYLELKLHFFEEKEKAFNNVINEVNLMLSK